MSWLETIPWWGRLIGMCVLIIAVAYGADRIGGRKR
jgi:hypothetical protein